MTKIASSLEEFELYYEEMETKVKRTANVKKAKKPVDTSSNIQPNIFNRLIVSRFKTIYRSLHDAGVGVVNKVKAHRETAKNVSKSKQKKVQNQRKNAILGIGLLLVVVSIAYSTFVVSLGVDSLASKIALLPQVVFALYSLLRAFSKIYQ